MEEEKFHTFRDKDNKYDYDIYLNRVSFVTYFSGQIDFLERQGGDINIIKTKFSTEVLDIIEEYINYGQLLICDSFRDMFNKFRETKVAGHEEVDEEILQDVLMILIYDSQYDEDLAWRTLWIRIKLEEQWAKHNDNHNNIVFDLDDEGIRSTSGNISRTSDLFNEFAKYLDADIPTIVLSDLNSRFLYYRQKTDFTNPPDSRITIPIFVSRVSLHLNLFTIQIDRTSYMLTSIITEPELAKIMRDLRTATGRGCWNKAYSDNPDLYILIIEKGVIRVQLFLIFTDAMDLLLHPYLPHWYQIVINENDEYIATDAWLYSYMTNQYLIDPIKFEELIGYRIYILWIIDINYEVPIFHNGFIPESDYYNLPIIFEELPPFISRKPMQIFSLD